MPRRNAECDAGEFQCVSDGACVPADGRCDDSEDCDGSDEDCGSTPFPARTCGAGQFTCGSKECVNDELRCNDIPDCGDASDEHHCPSTTTTTTATTTTTTTTAPTTKPTSNGDASVYNTVGSGAQLPGGCGGTLLVISGIIQFYLNL